MEGVHHHDETGDPAIGLVLLRDELGREGQEGGTSLGFEEKFLPLFACEIDQVRRERKRVGTTGAPIRNRLTVTTRMRRDFVSMSGPPFSNDDFTDRPVSYSARMNAGSTPHMPGISGAAQTQAAMRRNWFSI